MAGTDDFLPYAKAAGEVGKALNGMFGGSGPAAPSSSNGNRYDARFDSSGWSVNFGSGGVTSTRASADSQNEAAGMAALPVSNTLLMAGGLLLLVVLWKRKKG